MKDNTGHSQLYLDENGEGSLLVGVNDVQIARPLGPPSPQSARGSAAELGLLQSLEIITCCTDSVSDDTSITSKSLAMPPLSPTARALTQTQLQRQTYVLYVRHSYNSQHVAVIMCRSADITFRSPVHSP